MLRLLPPRMRLTARLACATVALCTACRPGTGTVTDSAAAYSALAEPRVAPRAPLTEATLAGTWNGRAMGMTSDAALNAWTQVCGAGTCRSIIAGSPDTLVQTYVLSGDSAVGTSAVYEDPSMRGVPLQDTWVVRVVDGTLTGTGRAHIATHPDSVLVRYRVEGTRAP